MKNKENCWKNLKHYRNKSSVQIGEEMDRDKIIRKLDKLKAEHPEQKIIVETPKGSVELKIGDALIYEGMRGEIVIDSE